MFGWLKPKPAPEPEAAENELPLTREALLPRIKHLNFQRALQEHGVPADQMPLIRPLVGDLIITYAFDLPDQFIMASPNYLAQAGISSAEAPFLALANLQQQAPESQRYSNGECSALVCGEHMEACLMLLDPLWDEIEAQLGCAAIVAVPRRDCLLIANRHDADCLDALRAEAQRFFSEGDNTHALSTQLMIRREGEWHVLPSA